MDNVLDLIQLISVQSILLMASRVATLLQRLCLSLWQENNDRFQTEDARLSPAVGRAAIRFGPEFFTTKLFVDIHEKLRMIGCVQEEIIMSDRQPPRPTDSELAILGVLWERGPSTVRDVHDALNKDGATGYTTVLKILQIMTEKGLVVRDETERAHVYESRYGEQKTQRQLLADLAERAFGGSATKLVMQALSGRKASASELTAIRELLDTLEGETR